MFGVEVSAIEQYLFVLPLQLGNLRINTPVSLASHLFTTSVHGTEQLVRSIVSFETFFILIVFLNKHLIVNY